MNKILSVVLILLTLSTPAIAAEYTANLEARFVKPDSNGNNSWSISFPYALNKTETWRFNNIDIKYVVDYETPKAIGFQITDSGSTNDMIIIENSEDCIKGSYCMDLTRASQGDIKLRLISITQKTGTATTTTTDNPVYVYYMDYDKERQIKKNEARTFDVVASTQRENSDALEEVEVYIRRDSGSPAISVSGPEEPDDQWIDNKVKYLIKKSGAYTFTIKYDKINPWGGTVEVIDTYKLDVAGLASKDTVAAIGTYDMDIADTKVIKMTQPGNFESQNSVTITPQGSDNSFAFKFSAPGNYRVKYKSNGGVETYVEFNVKQISTPTTEETQIDANQQQNQPGADVGFNYYIAAVIVVAAVGIVILRKRSRPKPAATHYVSK